MNIGMVILAAYVVVLLGIAFYAWKRDQKNIKDFATGGGLGIFVLTLTFSATYHSSYAFMGAGGFVFKNGVGWWVMAFGPCCPVCCSGFGVGVSGIWASGTTTVP